eukprot:2754004-Rhodomonas_salina.1
MAPRSGRTALLAAVSALAAAMVCLSMFWGRNQSADSLLGFWTSDNGHAPYAPESYVVPISVSQAARTRADQQALAGEISRLDNVRDAMYSQLSAAKGLGPLAVGAAGPHLLADLRGMAADAAQLRTRLNQAANAEEQLM